MTQCKPRQAKLSNSLAFDNIIKRGNRYVSFTEFRLG